MVWYQMTNNVDMIFVQILLQDITMYITVTFGYSNPVWYKIYSRKVCYRNVVFINSTDFLPCPVICRHLITAGTTQGCRMRRKCPMHYTNSVLFDNNDSITSMCHAIKINTCPQIIDPAWYNGIFTHGRHRHRLVLSLVIPSARRGGRLSVRPSVCLSVPNDVTAVTLYGF